METIYCQFCGEAANRKVRNARRLVGWIKANRDVVRCQKHRRTSKESPTNRTHDPLTGEKMARPPGRPGHRIVNGEIAWDEWR